MKTYTREIIAYVVVVFLLFLLWDLRRHSKNTEEQFKSAHTESKSQIKYLTNEMGRILSEKKTAEITSKQFIELYNAEAKQLREMDVRIKGLKAFVKAEIKASGSGLSTITTGDTDLAFTSEDPADPGESTLNFNDGYLSFSSSLPSMKSNYTYTDTLVYAISFKRKWFLGKESLYSSATMMNKNSKITNSTDVLINDYKDKRWAVTVGPYYDPFRGQAGVSIGIGYSLIKF